MNVDPRSAVFRHREVLHLDLRKLFTDDLPMPRCFLHGPKWRRHFGIVTRKRSWGCRGRLIFTFEPDVRELVGKGFNEPEELRPGVFAEWSEGLGC